MFFTFYAIAASLHEDVAASHLLEAPVRTRLTPPLEEDQEPSPGMLQGVSTIPEVYYFIENTYLPLLLQQADDLGNPLPRDEWGTLFQYNQIKGLIMMELQRSKKVKCEDDVADNLWCYPQGELTDEIYGRSFNDLSGGNKSYYLDDANG